VASLDLEQGRRVSMGDIAIMRLTPEQIQEQALPQGYMTNPQQIIGRMLNDKLTKGQTFMTDQLYPEGLGPSVSQRLKPGLRAVTVEIANEAAVAGLAPAGSFVDVYFRSTVSTETKIPETTMTLLEDVEVLALGSSLLSGTPAPTRPFAGNVTLAVTPEQASALKVVEGRGELMLALRSPEDTGITSESTPQTLESLLGVVAAPQAIPSQTTIFRGTAKSTESFSQETNVESARITGGPIRSLRPAEVDNEPTPVQPASGIEESSDQTSKASEENTSSVDATGATAAALASRDVVGHVADQVPTPTVGSETTLNKSDLTQRVQVPERALSSSNLAGISTAPLRASRETSDAQRNEFDKNFDSLNSQMGELSDVVSGLVESLKEDREIREKSSEREARQLATGIVNRRAEPLTNSLVASHKLGTQRQPKQDTTPSKIARTMPPQDRSPEPFRSQLFYGDQIQERVFVGGQLSSIINASLPSPQNGDLPPSQLENAIDNKTQPKLNLLAERSSAKNAQEAVVGAKTTPSKTGTSQQDTLNP